MLRINDTIKVFKNDVYYTRATVIKISGDLIYCVDSIGPFQFDKNDKSIKTERVNEK